MQVENLKLKAVSFFKTLAFILTVITKDFVQGKLPLRATSLVYTTILSFVPLLALSFSVLKSFGAHNELEPFLTGLFEPLGEKGLEVSQNILMFVDNIKVGVLGAIGLGFLLFTVISLVQKIESAFNSIWHVSRERSHVQRFTGYLSVITVGPLVLLSLLGLKAKFTTNPLVADVLGTAAVNTGYIPHIIDWISGIAMPILLFTFVNKAVPNTRVKWLPAIAAGVATALMWKTVASGFGAFMSNSANYDAIYSSFAIILLVFIWLYLNWLVILVGGSLCFYIQNPEQAKLTFLNANISFQDKIYQALKLLKDISLRFDEGKSPLTLKQTNKLLGGEIFATEVVNALCGLGVIGKEGEREQEVVLLKSLKTVTIFDVVDCLSGSDHVLVKRSDKGLSQVIDSMESAWKKQTLDKVLKTKA